MYTIAHALRRTDGDRRGRATLRLAMVGVLLATQALTFTDAGLAFSLHLWLLPSLCLGGLGASLGFAAAADRAGSSARAFLLDRARRAYPIYAVTILAAALVLGPLVTDTGRLAYLRDPQTFAYLLNLIGVPTYELPGVFEFNDIPRIVNAMVWIGPVYAALVAVAAVPSGRRLTHLVPAALLVAVVLGALAVQGQALGFEDGSFGALLAHGDALSAVAGGLIGLVLHGARRRVPLVDLVAAGCAAVLGAAVAVGRPEWLGTAAFRLLTVVPTAYLVVFLTVRRLGWGALARRVQPWLGGAVLMAYPLEQLASQFSPRAEFGLHVAAIAAAVALSALFWLLVGRRLAAPDEEAEADVAGDRPGGTLLARRWARGRRRYALAQGLTIALVLSVVFIGLMVLLYIALQPDLAT